MLARSMSEISSARCAEMYSLRRFCCHPARPPKGAYSAPTEPLIRMSSCKRKIPESFGVVTRCRFPDLALELKRGLPQVAVLEKQPGRELDLGKSQLGIEQGPGGMDVKVGDARKHMRFLPTAIPVADGNQGQSRAEVSQR